MMDIDTEDRLVREIGGKFPLTVLIQKRMVELLRSFSAKPLVKVDGDEASLRHTVFEEVRQHKIELTPPEEVDGSVEDFGAKGKKVVSITEAPEPTPETFGLDIKKIKQERIEEMARLFGLRSGGR